MSAAHVLTRDDADRLAKAVGGDPDGSPGWAAALHMLCQSGREFVTRVETDTDYAHAARLMGECLVDYIENLRQLAEVLEVALNRIRIALDAQQVAP